MLLFTKVKVKLLGVCMELFQWKVLTKIVGQTCVHKRVCVCVCPSSIQIKLCTDTVAFKVIPEKDPSFPHHNGVYPDHLNTET